MPPRILLGAMSGTSADGVDVAVVRISGAGLEMRAELVAFVETPYAPALRDAIFSIRRARQTSLADVCRVGLEISMVYATAIRSALQNAAFTPPAVRAVAVHGQTLFHDPPLTWQLIDPALIAYETGLDVVHDFRRVDCAAGGQGAPLVPFADFLLFRDPTRSRVILNIGGIANVTYLPAGATLADVIAFDTGPGNCLSDDVMRRLHPGGPGYDAGGELAASGRAHETLAAAVLADDYFRKVPPKSTDGPAMIEPFSRVTGSANLTAPDLLATALAVSADSIAHALVTHLPGPIDELFVAGGGVKNEALLRRLKDRLTCPIRPTDALGWPAQAREAGAFALLGAATLDRIPANVPTATGATRAVVLGSVTPAP